MHSSVVYFDMENLLRLVYVKKGVLEAVQVFYSGLGGRFFSVFDPPLSARSAATSLKNRERIHLKAHPTRHQTQNLNSLQTWAPRTLPLRLGAACRCEIPLADFGFAETV